MIFGAMNTAGSGLNVYQTWLDAVSDNIANMNDSVNGDAPVFQERFVQAQAMNSPDGSDGGVQITGIKLGDTTGRLAYEPNNPMANAKGYVKYADIDLGEQMTQMMLAQRGYQANLATIDRAKDAYQAALELGK
jgi:flagellar basal-body rod protein FlgC